MIRATRSQSFDWGKQSAHFLGGVNEKETPGIQELPTPELNIYRSLKQPEARDGGSVHMSPLQLSCSLHRPAQKTGRHRKTSEELGKCENTKYRWPGKHFVKFWAGEHEALTSVSPPLTSSYGGICLDSHHGQAGDLLVLGLTVQHTVQPNH